MSARPPSVRAKKLAGAVVMIIFVMVYALIAMALAQARIIQDAGRMAQAFFYAALGLGWVLPLLPLVRWMEKRR